MKILLMENTIEMCETLSAVLNIEGYQVEYTTSTKEGTNLLTLNYYDLILVDHWLVRREKAFHLLADITTKPIFVLSSYINAEKDFEDVKYRKIIKKPFSIEELTISINCQ